MTSWYMSEWITNLNQSWRSEGDSVSTLSRCAMVPYEASGLLHVVVIHWGQIHETEVVLVYISYHATRTHIVALRH